MNENWLNDNLCSFDEKVRVELGPQIIELDCTLANLDDNVTAPYYRAGTVDALGKEINPSPAEDGNTMHVVDRRAKHAPKVWKIYQWQPAPQDEKDIERYTELVASDDDPSEDAIAFLQSIMRWIKVDENEDKDSAIAIAKQLAEGM